MEVQKVHITGGPACGKTRLANHIASITGAPHYEWDMIALDIEALGKPFASIAEELPRIFATDAWVSEGAYMGWAEPLFEKAELVISLDVPWRVASYRILSRHVKASISGTNRFPGWRRLYRFWRWSSRFYNDSNPPGFNDFGVPDSKSMAASMLQRYRDKLVVCRTRTDIEELLRHRFSTR